MSHSQPASMPSNAVAVIGAGPAGLVNARWLLRRGFEPVLFEAAEQLGGQWNSASPLSGTWRGMPTNTSRILTAFSDLTHAQGTAVYPRQHEMLDYLHRYADRFALGARIRLRTSVDLLEQHMSGGWLLSSRCDGRVRTEVFQHVVIASGRYVAPDIPALPGLKTFSGALGAIHTSQYDGAASYRDKNVVVAGGSISALEIASEIALGGARSVTAAYGRQRYIVPKLIAGVPADHVFFTRAAALLGEALPPQALAENLREAVLRVAGNPLQFGARAPVSNFFEAGISQSQHFLPLVAEGRIVTRPWIERINGRSVVFHDGSSTEADALLLGTGYRLSLPWLSDRVARVLDLDDQHIDLCDHTFHPELPGLAFAGLFDVTGPCFPVLELQARWIASALASATPTRAEIAEGLERCRAARGRPQKVMMHALAMLFARRAGVEPNIGRWPRLQRALLFGPLSPACFRLDGPDNTSDAVERTRTDAAEFGAVQSDEWADHEKAILNIIRDRVPAGCL